MDGPAQYLHFGLILISLANLIVIALLIVVLMLAVALRRPEKQRLSTLEAVPKAEEARERDAAILVAIWSAFAYRRVQPYSSRYFRRGSYVRRPPHHLRWEQERREHGQQRAGQTDGDQYEDQSSSRDLLARRLHDRR